MTTRLCAVSATFPFQSRLCTSMTLVLPPSIASSVHVKTVFGKSGSEVFFHENNSFLSGTISRFFQLPVIDCAVVSLNLEFHRAANARLQGLLGSGTNVWVLFRLSAL
jgi:hypothetical protein